MTEAATGLVEWAAAFVSLLGAFLFFASAVGLLRLPDFYTRVHAPTKAATAGISLLVAASALRSLVRQDVDWVEDLIIILFLWITVPVSSQILLRVASLKKVPQSPSTEGEQPEE